MLKLTYERKMLLSLTSITEILNDAKREGYAVGAFNIHTMEVCQGVIRAAERENSPVILQINQGTIKYAGVQYVSAVAKVAAESTKVPVAIHLDHGTDFEIVMSAIRAGFNSVMIDASTLPYEENIALVLRVVEAAHSAGVAVEAELGKVGGVEDDISLDEREAAMTDPAIVPDFVERTGVDSLAIAIGTAHGVYKGVPKLDFERLRVIRGMVDIPLVLHGASGVPDESIRRAVEFGINKINISTELKIPFTSAIRNILLNDPGEFDPRVYLGSAREAVEAVAREKMRLFGCSGKAKA